MVDLNETPTPTGFQVGNTLEGYLEIQYRTKGMGCFAFFNIVWLSFWTFICVFFTYDALFARDTINIGILLFMVPFWLTDFLVLGYTLWLFRSIIIFSFNQNSLLVQRSLFGFHHRRTILKQEIDMVRQIKDGGEGEDSFPSWGLAIEGQKKAKILSRQEYEKSEWLGPIVAAWAGVAFEPCKKE